MEGERVLEFDVTINAKILYDYLLRHTYNSAAGILGSTAGALGIVAFFLTGYLPYLIFGVILLLYLPISLSIRARRQAANPVFSKPLHYKMTEDGVSVSQDGEEQFQKWEDMYQAVSTSRSIILYTGKYQASIFPRVCLAGMQSDVIAMISAHMPPKKVKIRG